MLNFKVIGEGKPIIFLHGWGGSTDSFLGIAKMLSRENKCILVDFFGHGKTPVPSGPLFLCDFTKAIEEIIDHLQLERVAIVGHSFGGRVAIDISQNSKIDKIILVDSAGLKPRHGLKYYARVIAYKIAKKTGRDLSKYGSDDYKKLCPIMKKTFVNIVNFDLKNNAKSIVQPTLIVWGKNDKDTPFYMAKKLKKYIKNSEMIAFNEVGHYSYLEKYYDFYLILKAFLRG